MIARSGSECVVVSQLVPLAVLVVVDGGALGLGGNGGNDGGDAGGASGGALGLGGNGGRDGGGDGAGEWWEFHTRPYLNFNKMVLNIKQELSIVIIFISRE